MGRKLNLEGQKFGRLTALHEDGRTHYGSVLWNCLCECGNFTKVAAAVLRSGNTKSCGCLSADQARELNSLPKDVAGFNFLFSNYKHAAKKRGLKFDITKKQFKKLTSSDCYYCNVSPFQINKSKKVNNGFYVYNGIDRVNNSKGYTSDNCVPCCGKCNKMKIKMSQEEFFSQIQKIYVHRVRGDE